MLKITVNTVSSEPRNRLITERYRHGWSQQEVADLIGTTRLNVSRWERNMTNPGPYFRRQLCELFKTDETELGLIPEPILSGGEATPWQQQQEPSTLIDYTLPLPLENLIGRDSEVCQIKNALLAGKRFLALQGLSGVGKTALACSLAYDSEVRAAFCDGVLYARLGANPDVPDILKRWGTLLGISNQQATALTTAEAWRTAIGAIIGQHKLLLILDDAYKLDDILACTVGGPQCAYLLTTRFPAIALTCPAKQIMHVCELDDHQSVELIQHLASITLTLESTLLQPLIERAGGLPLVLTLLGNAIRVQTHDRQPRRVCSVLSRLQDARNRLCLAEPQSLLERSPFLPGIPVSLQASIATSEQYIDPQARSLLRALSHAFPAKPDSFSEAEALDICQGSFEALDMLCDAGLLESAGPGKYALHPVIADYAQCS